MIIHFVCSGNSFRSRLAEAYFNSLKIPGFRATSSGAHSYLDTFNHISTHAKVVLENEGLTKYSGPEKTQLTQSLLNKSDIIVCMNRTVYQEALGEGVHFPDRTYIWDIDDIKQFSKRQKVQLVENSEPIVVQTIFHAICHHVDELVSFLKRPHPTEQIDILDEEGQPIGKTGDIAAIHENGWWHAGAHIGLYTSKGKVLLERRSSNIVFNPGLWDVSMGGVVKKGETPADAIIREAKEELGVKLNRSELHEIFISRYNHHLPRYGYHNRNLTHTFIAQISESITLTLQTDEVAEAKFMPIEQVRKMNANAKNNNLVDIHAYYEKILDAIEKELSDTSS